MTHVQQLTFFLLKLAEETKICNVYELKGLKQTFYYLSDQSDTKKIHNRRIAIKPKKKET